MQVGGWSLNTIPDPYSMVFLGYQTRGFFSEHGIMQDMGTLGGPDTLPEAMNQRGQVIGTSYTNSTPNADTGIPTVDPFIWEDGNMVDLGTLGGVFGVANFINSGGKVVGVSDLAGDQTQHPFLWDRGSLMDLGTLGGDNGNALWINDAGDVIGEADLPGSQTHDAFLWRHGVMTDLGNLGQTSYGYAINSDGQVIGHSKLLDGTFHAFLWEHGGPMVDLNTLVFPTSNILVVDPYDINDRGEIAATGFLPNGDQHAVLLIPNGDCDKECEGGALVPRTGAVPTQRPSTVNARHRNTRQPNRTLPQQNAATI